MPRLHLNAPLLRAAAASALSLAAGTVAQAAQDGATVTGPSVAWRMAAGDADISSAFAQAKDEQKPLLLYWGAKWCPPCNQLKATLFNRADFIERSRSVVAVQIDGDLPGAQKLGGRFKVRGYPTMILMAADGQEITRLPGEVDAPQVLAVLQLGMAGGRPIKSVLADARAGKSLSPAEWRLLSFYAWDLDEDQLVPAAERAGTLVELALACPAAQTETAQRLLLRALAESDEGKGMKPDAGTVAKVRALLANPAATRVQMDLVVNAAPDMVKALAPKPGPERQSLVAAFDTALKRLQADTSLSRGDRLGALGARVDLARIDQPKDLRNPKLPAALLAEVKAQAERDDAQISDAYERQAVITGDAHVLAHAGLWGQSDALLKTNLPRSHSPYYLMSQLGSNAQKQGRKTEALDWFGQAYAGSQGPATRLQWGASYFSALVELAPADAAKIEQVATQIFAEAGDDPSAFHERSARSLQRVGNKLKAWAAKGAHEPMLGRLRTQLDGVCAKLPADDPQRATCDKLAQGVGGAGKA